MRHGGKNYYTLLLMVALSLTLLIGCGGGGGGGGGGLTSGSEESIVATATIASQGGTVTLKDVSVTIPQDIFSQEVKVTLSETSSTNLGIDNNQILGTPIQITIEPTVNASKSEAMMFSNKSVTSSAKNFLTFAWNNIDETVAAISASTCIVAKVASIGQDGAVKELANIPCKLSKSTAIATELSFLDYANDPLQKIAGTYVILSPSSLKEYSSTPSLKSFALTNSSEQGSSRKFDNSNLNGRTPIILIHGINREENLRKDCKLNNTEEERFWCYEYKREVWDTFYNEAAKSAGFFDKFKVYEYIYPSFQNSITNGLSLVSLIKGNSELSNSRIFFIAHSYGGLVVRRAMNRPINNGLFGDQTINFFTLATPHHGSIGASLLYLVPTTLNDPVINNLLSDKIFFAALNIVKVYYGSAAYTPGYMDLTWDNFDNGGIPQHWIDNGGLFVNDGLKVFNENDGFKNKIIEYSGGNLENTVNIDSLTDTFIKYIQDSSESNLTSL